METYTAARAARALGISLDTLRRWDKAGRIAVERDASNRRVVPAAEVARLRGERGGEALSARNRLAGIVAEAKADLGKEKFEALEAIVSLGSVPTGDDFFSYNVI